MRLHRSRPPDRAQPHAGLRRPGRCGPDRAGRRCCRPSTRPRRRARGRRSGSDRASHDGRWGGRHEERWPRLEGFWCKRPHLSPTRRRCSPHRHQHPGRSPRPAPAPPRHRGRRGRPSHLRPALGVTSNGRPLVPTRRNRAVDGPSGEHGARGVAGITLRWSRSSCNVHAAQGLEAWGYKSSNLRRMSGQSQSRFVHVLRMRAAFARDAMDRLGRGASSAKPRTRRRPTRPRRACPERARRSEAGGRNADLRRRRD